MDNYNGYQNAVYQPNYYQQNYQPAYPQQYQPYQQQAQQPVVYQSAKNWQYQPQYQQSYQQPPTATQMSYQQNMSGNIIWIRGGLDGAKAYNNIQPGIPVALWDEDENVIYIKSLDQTGKPQITILDYNERNSADSVDGQPDVKYATKDQIDSISKQLAVFNERFDGITGYVTEDQFNDLSSHLNDLNKQVDNIENRITSFGKPQNNNTTRKEHR